MKKFGRIVFFLVCIFSFMFLTAYFPSTTMAAKQSAKQDNTIDSWKLKPKASFDANKIGDMSDFDPNTWEGPQGDVIKIAYVNTFSGPGAINGQIHWPMIIFAVHDINKRGGIMINGKRKLITVIKADHQSKADVCKKICERMVLQEKVHILMGTTGTAMMKVINEVANKYKIIAVNEGSPTEELMDATNFGRYSIMPSPCTEQFGRGLAYYYGQIRKKEKKFYIICQDYSFGRAIADGFKKGLKEYFPAAQIVGEDYHKLFLTDYAPFLTKIKASDAEVIYTGDWVPDAANLLKQARQMGITLPFANIYLTEPNMLHDIGIDGTQNLVCIDPFETVPAFKEPARIKLHKAWNDQSKKWKAPYNTPIYEHAHSNLGLYMMSTYWLLSVIERAGSLDPDNIIKVWEGDTYRFANKVYKMRACDHKAISDFSVFEFGAPDQQKASFNIPPYHWYKNISYYGTGYTIPASMILPPIDEKLDRCKGKSQWGE